MSEAWLWWLAGILAFLVFVLIVCLLMLRWGRKSVDRLNDDHRRMPP